MIAIVVGRLFPSSEGCSVASVGCKQVIYDKVPQDVHNLRRRTYAANGTF